MRLFDKCILLGVVVSLAVAARADVIKGHVVDAKNRPVPNAEVLVQTIQYEPRRAGYSALRADSNGNFSANLTPGSYSYYGQFFAVAPGMAPDNVRLTSNSRNKINTLHLSPAQAVSGHVIDQDGKPLAGVTVKLRNMYNRSISRDVFLSGSLWEKRYQTTTDKNGRWQLKGVAAGDKAGMTLVDPRYVTVLFESVIDKPSVTRTRPGGAVIGRVVDETGKPLADVKVLADGNNMDGGGTAVTAADGSYRITGLSTGAYDIEVYGNTLPLVARPLKNQIAHEGQTAKVPDLVMTPGGIVSGQVLDRTTGQPVKGAFVASSGTMHVAGDSDYTDANGHYSLRVLPGKTHVYLSGAGPEYLPAGIADGVDVMVRENQTVTQNFTAKRGEAVSGIVVDRDGKPLADVKIWVSDGQVVDAFQNTHVAYSDANGKWRVPGLAEVPVEISAAGDWVSVAPVKVTLPHSAQVRLTAQKLNDLPPQGNVVDLQHRPLSNIKVQLQYETFDNGRGSGEMWYGDVISDANGNLRFQPVPSVTSVKVSKIDQPGYLLKSGGNWDAATKRLGEIVADRLDNSVCGRVLRQKNNAAPGASVLAAGFPDAITQTGKSGEFTLNGLPHQPITLLTTADNQVAKSLSQTGAPTILTLKPLPKNHFPTRAQSLDMLEKLYRDSAGKHYYARRVIPYEIAKYDLQRGLNLLQDASGKITSSQFYPVLYLLKEEDPARALQWGKDHLAEITADDDRVQILCELAKMAQPTDKALAQKYFSEAVAIARKFPAPQQKTYSSDEPTDSVIGKFLYSRVQLAGAAAVVRPGQTHQWVAAIFPYSVDPNRGTRGDYDWIRDAMAQSLDANAPQETEALVENSTGRAKTTELKSAVEAAVRAKNPELAQRWLDQMQQLYQQHKEQNPPWEGRYDFGQAIRSVIELIGPKDPARALKLARLIDDQSETAQSLMVAAAYQPKQAKLATLKEAFEMQSLINGSNLARMAGLIYDIDPAQGKVLFDRLLQQYESQAQDENSYSSRRISGVGLAYFLARYKPVVSWKILQNAHAKSQLRADKSSVDWGIALAMSALNFDEAMNWAAQETPRDGFNYDAQRKLLQLALVTPEVRRTLRFDRLGASDTWMPGEPTGW